MEFTTTLLPINELLMIMLPLYRALSTEITMLLLHSMPVMLVLVEQLVKGAESFYTKLCLALAHCTVPTPLQTVPSKQSLSNNSIAYPDSLPLLKNAIIVLQEYPHHFSSVGTVISKLRDRMSEAFIIFLVKHAQKKIMLLTFSHYF